MFETGQSLHQVNSDSYIWAIFELSLNLFNRSVAIHLERSLSLAQ